MKTVKKILVVFVGVLIGVIALGLIVALFVKKEYTVERAVTIDKPKTEVFNYVKYLKNQNDYSVWANMDPNMEKVYKGTDGTVGFVSAWSSKDKNVGKGEQEIKDIQEGSRIDYELRFIEPFEATDYAYMITDSTDGNHTLVRWGFFGRMDYPANLMLLFMDMEQMLGKDLEGGLANLKSKLEK